MLIIKILVHIRYKEYYKTGFIVATQRRIMFTQKSINIILQRIIFIILNLNYQDYYLRRRRAH